MKTDYRNNFTIIKLFIFLLLFLLILPASVAAAEAEGKIQSAELLYAIPRQIQYSFTLQNKTAQIIKNAEFWTYAPVKQTAHQYCEQIKSSHPYQLTTDNLGNQVLYFTVDTIPPFGSKIISITVELMLAERPVLADLADMQEFVEPEKYIEANHPDIQKLAATLKASTAMETARNAFQWTANNIRYAGYVARDRGAFYALKHKKGDCTEYMYLFGALCRANRIPARPIGGYICRSNGILKPSGYHNWAEFYDAGTWNSVDPQNKVFMENSSDYIAMRIIGDTTGNPMGTYHRFRFRGDGLAVRMNR
jgi:transglutaminase-like putative cysteine protease